MTFIKTLSIYIYSQKKTSKLERNIYLYIDQEINKKKYTISFRIDTLTMSSSKKLNSFNEKFMKLWCPSKSRYWWFLVLSNTYSFTTLLFHFWEISHHQKKYKMDWPNLIGVRTHIYIEIKYIRLEP